MLDSLKDKLTDAKERVKDFLKRKYGKEYAEMEKTSFSPIDEESNEYLEKESLPGGDLEAHSYNSETTFENLGERYKYSENTEKGERSEFVESDLEEEKDFDRPKDLDESDDIEKIRKKIENLAEKIDLIIMDLDTIKTQEEYLKAAMKRQINILKEILQRVEELEEEHREIWKVLTREREKI